MSPEERAAYNRAYHAANKEKLAEYAHAYYAANKEKLAVFNRAYREANKEKVSARERAYREALGPRGRFAKLLHLKYDLSFEAWTEMLIGQSGRCAICRSPMSGIKEPATDHNHETGEVRELLCVGCNTKLHALEVWPHLGEALTYLEKHKARPLGIVRDR